MAAITYKHTHTQTYTNMHLLSLSLYLQQQQYIRVYVYIDCQSGITSFHRRYFDRLFVFEYSGGKGGRGGL